LELAAFKNWLNNNKNAQSSGNREWIAGDTVMSDLSDVDFHVRYLNLKVPEKSEVKGATTASSLKAGPSSWNWVEQGKVPAVKDQGGCGSCWAFGVIGAIESLKLINENKNAKDAQLFSEQYLVDCSKGYGGLGGCNGGWPSTAMKWIATNGMVKSASWGYEKREQTCPTNLEKVAFKITGSGNAVGDAELEKAIAQQPVVVAVDASRWSSYTGGIFGASTSECSTSVNHAVIAVGYTPEYWLIRNSWSEGWGEKGYIKLSRARANTCGVSAYGSYPIASKENSNNNNDNDSDTSELVDSNPNCPGWAKAGYCTTPANYAEYMKTNCVKSCSGGNGQNQSDLVDIGKYCAQWAANGLCTCPTYGQYMKENCAKTCSKP
jgi:C1A family cysteine protease